MKHLLWLWLLCSMVSCSSTPPRPNDKAVYGDPAADTVEVTVGIGFQFPGTYHVPEGTKLGRLIDIAKVLPAVKEWRDGVTGNPVPCQVRWANKLYRAVAEQGELGRKNFRELVLHDGDEVAFIVWNF